MTQIGPHLLGRRPSPPDHRDLRLAHFLAPSPLDAALAKLTAARGVPLAVKQWAATVTAHLEGCGPQPPAAPTPPPVASSVVWVDHENVLDQGNTGHCVGFGWAQWGNTDPVNDAFRNSDGDAIYYEAKVIDGEPNEESGSSVRSGAKAMRRRKRLSAYAFARSVEEVRAFVRSKGPLVVGTNWTDGMFHPNGDSFVRPTGALQGGHCYLLVGDLPGDDAFLFQNSWGSRWGMKGRFKIRYSDFAELLADHGEACAAVELPRDGIDVPPDTGRR